MKLERTIFRHYCCTILVMCVLCVYVWSFNSGIGDVALLHNTHYMTPTRDTSPSTWNGLSKTTVCTMLFMAYTEYQRSYLDF